MRQDRRFQKKKWLDDDRKRMIPVIVIPTIVICLMVIIVIADHMRDAKAAAAAQPSAAAETMQEQESLDGQTPSEESDVSGEDNADGEEAPEGGETESEAEAPEESEETEPFVTETFQRDSVPEILDLMKRYFQARVEADAETMNQIYGVGEVSVTALEAQKTRMRRNAKYIQSIENVTTYETDGTEADSWLVYAVADIRFYSVKNTAPMIMWCYVTKDADGNYLILNNEVLTQEQQNLINAINHSEPVRRLASDVNGRLKEALNSDDDLREIYGVLRDGSPVWNGEGEDEQVKILDEPTEEASSEVTVGVESDAAEAGADAAEENQGDDAEASGENPEENNGENTGTDGGEAAGAAGGAGA